MDIELEHVKHHVEELAKNAGGIANLAESLEVSRTTIYTLIKGGWPSHKLAEKLNLRLVVKS